MASANNINQTSATVSGELDIMSSVILETDIFTKFSVVKAVRDKFRMWEGSVSDDIIQDYSDNPDETGTTNISDEEFTIKKKSVKHNVNYDSFKDTEMAVSVSNLKDQQLPAPFVETVSNLTGKKASKFAAQDLYNSGGGLTGDPATYPGLASLIKTKLTAASLTNRIVTSATLDPTDKADIPNVLASLQGQLSVDMVEAKDEFVWLMNGVVNDAWYEHLSEVAATNIPQSSALKFKNYNLEIAKGLSSRRVIVCKKENINIALAVSGELLDLTIVDQYMLGNGNRARVVGNYGYGIGIATDDFAIFEFTA